MSSSADPGTPIWSPPFRGGALRLRISEPGPAVHRKPAVARLDQRAAHLIDVEDTMATTQTEGPAPHATGAAGERPSMTAVDEVAWGPAPGVFPAGCAFCVLHGDPGAAGREFTVRLKASEGYCFAPHSHPHDEHVTVITGALLLGNGARADRESARTLGPGGYAFLPREEFHYAWTTEDDTVFQVNAVGPFAITYANPADDPRNAPTH